MIKTKIKATYNPIQSTYIITTAMLSMPISNQDTASNKSIEPVDQLSYAQSRKMTTKSSETTSPQESSPDKKKSSPGLRHDEQACEEHFDDRSEAHDDVEKQKIRFSHTKLYGRDKELERLFNIYDGMMMRKEDRRYSSVTTEIGAAATAEDSSNSVDEEGTARIVFLPGYSGTGKSSLVHEFMKQLRDRERNEESKVDYSDGEEDSPSPTSRYPPSSSSSTRRRPRYICGKYQELTKAADPYSAIADGLNKYFKSIHAEARSFDRSKGEKKNRHQNPLSELETTRYLVKDALGDYSATLVDVIPSLSNILVDGNSSITERTAPVEGSSGRGDDGDVDDGLSVNGSITTKSHGERVNKTGEMVKHMLRNVIASLCTEESPLILFLDDLQWMDECSMNLLLSLLSDETLRHFMFVGAYRSNEVLEQDQIQKREGQSKDGVDSIGLSQSFVSSLIADLTDKGRQFERIDLSELKFEDITEFVADTLSLQVDAVKPLSRAVYNKTLGNIFFTMQALEELVLRNGLYYDVMFFKWEWNISQLELETLLSDDIVQMVQFKIQNLEPECIQHLLTVASYTRATVTVETMTDAMNVVTAASVFSPPTTSSKPTSSSSTTESSGDSQPQVESLDTIYDTKMMEKYLNKAVEKGLLVANNSKLPQRRSGAVAKDCNDNREFTFAHDRIQEAARELVNEEERERLCFHLAQELGRQAQGSGEDWMLFTAVSHLNSLSKSFFHKEEVGMVEERHDGTCDNNVFNDAHSQNKDTVSLLYLARLNLRGAKAAIGRSAFRQAVEFLRRGIASLDENYANNAPGEAGNLKWRYQYDLCLELFNHLLESEFAVGDREGAQISIKEVMEFATRRNGQDQLLAQFISVEIIYTQDRDFDKVLETGLSILAKHNIKIPMKPSAARVAKEMLALQLAMGPRRTLVDLVKEPHMDEYHEQVMRFMPQLSKAALLSGRNELTTLVNLTAQRLSWEQGINEHLPTMLPNYGSVLRRQGKLREAMKVAVATEELIKNICHGPTWCRGMHMWGGALSPICAPLAYCANICKDVHREAMACGEGYTALLSAMIYSLSYFSAGLHVNAVFEAKMAHFLRECKSLALTPSLTVMFRIFHQTTLNLQGKGNTANPVQLAGRSLDEEKALAEFDGSARNQTFRDISVFRLILACVYHDEAAMEELIERLEEYPEIDLCFPRHHLRDVFMGLAAFHLSRVGQKQDRQRSKKFLKIGKQKLTSFQQLWKLAKSENAAPVIHCLRAVENPSRSNFDKAIGAARASNMMHLEAMMTEWCGLFLIESEKNGGKNLSRRGDRGISTEAEKYLTDAMWVYFDWGALGKVKRMREGYKFLHNAHRDASKMFKLP